MFLAGNVENLRVTTALMLFIFV